MKTAKNAPTAFRFDATVKAALSLLADKDGRSMANMLEWLIKKQCEREGLGWPPSNVETSASPPGRTGGVSGNPARKRAASAAPNKN